MDEDNNVRDLESHKLLKDSGKAIEDMETMINDFPSLPEDKQLEFLKSANEILSGLNELIEECRKKDG